MKGDKPDGLRVEGNLMMDGGGTNPFLPAICPVHGLVEAELPFRIAGTATLKNNSGQCPNCGMQSQFLEGTFDFADRVVRLLKDVSVSKKEARRFIRKVETNNDIDAIETTAAAINPALGSVAALAKAQPDPRSALKTAAKIVYYAIIVGTALIAGGYNGQLWYEHNFPETGLDIKHIVPEEAENDPGGKSSDKNKKPQPNWPKPTEI